MKKTKSQKGVTLVTLVVTIIILVILAFAAISAITEGGLITSVENVALKHSQSIEDEKEKYENNDDILNTFMPETEDETVEGGWVQEGLAVKKDDATLQVGSTVKYNAGVSGYTGGWQLLGVQNGKILLVSTKNVADNISILMTSNYGSLTSSGTGYSMRNEINTLNNKCAAYGKGEYAEKARSITADDIRIATDIKLIRESYEDEYGFPASRYVLSESSIENIEASNIYKTLFNNTESENGSYWLATAVSSIVGDEYDEVGLQVMSNSTIWLKMLGIVSNSGTQHYDAVKEHGVRAVVVLKDNVKIDANGNLSY